MRVDAVGAYPRLRRPRLRRARPHERALSHPRVLFDNDLLELVAVMVLGWMTLGLRVVSARRRT